MPQKDKNDGFLEGAICFAIFGSFVLVSMYNVKVISSGLEIYYDEYNDFTEGWKFIGGKKDSADYEWETAKSLFTSLFPYIVFHVSLTEILRFTKKYTFIPLGQILTTIAYIIVNFNVYSVALLLFQTLIFHQINYLFGRAKWKVWLCAALNLALLELFKTCEKYECLTYLKLTDVQHSVIVLAVYWINLRCICFYASDSRLGTMAHSIAYSLYLPTLFFGPIIDYNDFSRCYSVELNTFSVRIRIFLVKLIRFMFWWGFTDIWLHFIYVNVISLHPNLVNRLDSLTLYGFGYCMGQFFHLKYVVMYGLSTTIAEFDNMPIPNVPKCIGRIHLYSDMWKYFDNGLYKFLLKYIYLPVKNSTSCKYFASFVCFSFVYVWHGFLRDDILIWTFLNYVAVSLEYLFKSFYEETLQRRTANYLNAVWEQRFICVLNAPLLMLSAVSNFYFFAGVDIGNVFVNRIFTDKLQSTFLLLFSLYCCGQLSIMVKNCEKSQKIRKDKRE